MQRSVDPTAATCCLADDGEATAAGSAWRGSRGEGGEAVVYSRAITTGRHAGMHGPYSECRLSAEPSRQTRRIQSVPRRPGRIVRTARLEHHVLRACWNDFRTAGPPAADGNGCTTSTSPSFAPGSRDGGLVDDADDWLRKSRRCRPRTACVSSAARWLVSDMAAACGPSIACGAGETPKFVGGHRIDPTDQFLSSLRIPQCDRGPMDRDTTDMCSTNARHCPTGVRAGHLGKRFGSSAIEGRSATEAAA